MRKRIDVDKAKELWDNMYSLQMISDEIGFSRQGIKKALNAAGIDTSKDATWQNLTCPQCGEMFKKSRALTRNHPGKMYCNSKCYYDAIHNEAYKPWRHGQRIARATVEAEFPLMPGNVVHHIDGDNHNNDLGNLMVFASQSDHTRYHRTNGAGAVPLYIGGSS